MSAREIKKTQLSKSRGLRTISNRGLTLIELLVTMSIATIILVAVGDLGTMTLRTSMLAKAQSTTVDLKETLSSALGSGSDSCKGNLAPVKAGPPPFGELSGANQNKGVGKIDILRRYAGPTKGAVLVKKGEAFKGDLDIVAMRLIDPLETTGPPAVLINDPKTAPPKTREFYVFFKMRGVGPLGTKGPDCKETSTLTKLKSDCYSVKCTVMKYRLNSQTVTSHAEFNKVEECGEVNCIALSKGFGGGGSAACYTADGANPEGKTLAGCGTTKNITGDETTSFGFNAGNGTGVKNVFMGVNAGKAVTTGEQNVVMGYQAGEHLTTGVANVYIGQGAGYKNNGGANVAIGQGAGGNAKPDSFSGTYNFNSRNNVFIGAYAGWHNDGPNNVFIGHNAGNLNIKGGGNTFLGTQAGEANTSGNNNVFLGYQAGKANASKNGVTYIGAGAGASSTGDYNTFIGHNAGNSNTAGTRSVLVGDHAGQNTTTCTPSIGTETTAGYCQNTFNFYRALFRQCKHNRVSKYFYWCCLWYGKHNRREEYFYRA